jgi:hypothetical protein
MTLVAKRSRCARDCWVVTSPGRRPTVLIIVDGFAPSPVLGAFGADEIHRDLHARRAVDAAPSYGPGLCIVGVLIDDLIAEEACGLWPRVRDHAFGGREREGERLPQVLPQLPLDRFGPRPWATDTQEPIVRVPDGPEASKVWVVSSPVPRRPVVGPHRRLL